MARVFIDLRGTSLLSEERILIAHPNCAGVVLFARNYQNPSQLKLLTDAIKQHAQSPFLIAVDQEGGQVQRFMHGMTSLPSLYALGQMYDQAPEEACHKTFATAKTCAHELQAIGVDLCLGPVLDLHHPDSAIIGQKKRAFHACSNAVIQLASAWIDGMQSEGMKCIGKHFPGHGRVALDSHIQTITDPRTLAECVADLQPFKALTPKLFGMMPAHITFPNVCSDVVSQSQTWLTQILRHQLGFDGLCISDCITMAGSGHDDILTKIQRTLAVCDMVIWSHCEGYGQPLWPISKRVAYLLSALDQLEPAPATTHARLTRIMSNTTAPSGIS